ncbi:MAG: hypothetical protein ABFS45_25120, partial [Pseudomonadota bacterium]
MHTTFSLYDKVLHRSIELADVFQPLNGNFLSDPREALYNEQHDEQSRYQISILYKKSLGDLC